jgi:hypothetical protein
MYLLERAKPRTMRLHGILVYTGLWSLPNAEHLWHLVCFIFRWLINLTSVFLCYRWNSNECCRFPTFIQNNVIVCSLAHTGVSCDLLAICVCWCLDGAVCAVVLTKIFFCTILLFSSKQIYNFVSKFLIWKSLVNKICSFSAFFLTGVWKKGSVRIINGLKICRILVIPINYSPRFVYSV